MPTFWNADKLVHCICFAGLAFWVAFAVGTKLPAQWRIALPMIIVSVWGITDEIHQSFTPGRESSVFDWCADTVGAIVGSLVFFYFCKGIDSCGGFHTPDACVVIKGMKPDCDTL